MKKKARPAGKAGQKPRTASHLSEKSRLPLTVEKMPDDTPAVSEIPKSEPSPAESAEFDESGIPYNSYISRARIEEIVSNLGFNMEESPTGNYVRITDPDMPISKFRTYTIEMETFRTVDFYLAMEKVNHTKDLSLLHKFAIDDIIFDKQATNTGDIITEKKLKRPYRKAQQQPRPDLSHRAEENRLKKSTGLRLDEEVLNKVDAQAEAEGITRTEWLTRIVRRALRPS